MDSVDRIVKDYIEAVLKYSDERKKNKPKEANKQYPKIKKSYDLLRESDSVKELLQYLNHEDDYVKLWVAGHCLGIDQEKAGKALEELSKKKGIIAFEAKMTLEQWEKGKLKF